MPTALREQVPDFELVEKTFSVGIGATVKIAAADSDRWSIMFAVGTNQAFVATKPDTVAVSGGGILIASTTSPVIISYRDVGPLVGSEWWARSSAGTVTITVWTTAKPR